MSTVTDDQIVEAMIVYGGSFVEKLGLAYRQADYINQGRLKRAFPDYWQQYADLASLKQAQRDKAGV
jgi:hypothetical protein